MSTKTYTAELLWKWQDSLEEELRTDLMAAVQRTWPYAQLSAWSYLHDESLCVDIMEQSLESIYSYALRTSPRPSAGKLTARLRSQVRRVTKQMANRRRKEEAVGSTHDLEHACGKVLPFATPTSTCRSRFTICSAVCFFPRAIAILFQFVSSQLVQKEPGIPKPRGTASSSAPDDADYAK